MEILDFAFWEGTAGAFTPMLSQCNRCMTHNGSVSLLFTALRRFHEAMMARQTQWYLWRQRRHIPQGNPWVGTQ